MSTLDHPNPPFLPDWLEDASLRVRRAGPRVPGGVDAAIDALRPGHAASQRLAAAIDQCAEVGQLRDVTPGIDALATMLSRGGVPFGPIAQLTAGLRERRLVRIWSLVAPAELQAHSCLLMMGSGGRREQVHDADQDIALLLRGGHRRVQAEAAAAALDAALAATQGPPRPGAAAPSDRRWRQSLPGFQDSLRDWVYGHDPTGPVRVGLFVDSRAVAGDATLWEDARDYLDRILVGSESFLRRLTGPVLGVDRRPTWWQRLTGWPPVRDLERAGLLPIVHGLRALALKQRLRTVGSDERLSGLVEQGQLGADLARELLDALHALMAAEFALGQRPARTAHAAPDGAAGPELGILERDRLRNALRVAQRFRGVLRQRFGPDAG